MDLCTLLKEYLSGCDILKDRSYYVSDLMDDTYIKILSSTRAAGRVIFDVSLVGAVHSLAQSDFNEVVRYSAAAGCCYLVDKAVKISGGWVGIYKMMTDPRD